MASCRSWPSAGIVSAGVEFDAASTQHVGHVPEIGWGNTDGSTCTVGARLRGTHASGAIAPLLGGTPANALASAPASTGSDGQLAARGGGGTQFGDTPAACSAPHTEARCERHATSDSGHSLAAPTSLPPA